LNRTPFLVAVMGPTASGKTGLAESLAQKHGAQLINADAFQVYRGMDIGTAKPTEKSAYLLVDLKSPRDQYGVGEFCSDASKALQELWLEQRSAVLVGGTGLYSRALLEGYTGLQPEPDPDLRRQLQDRLKTEGLDALVSELHHRDPNTTADTRNPVRVTRALERLADERPPLSFQLPPFCILKLGIDAQLEVLHAGIQERVKGMVQNGWVQEVQRLLEQGFGPGDPGFRAIGYSEIAGYLLGKTDLEEAIAAATAETRRYAKRQRTWLRSEPSLVRIDGGDGVLSAAEAAIRAMYI